MGPYCDRLCWNSQNWVHPTGEAACLEKNSYAADHGFWHEVSLGGSESVRRRSPASDGRASGAECPSRGRFRPAGSDSGGYCPRISENAARRGTRRSEET
jgi:hypothetical protein